MIVVSQRKLRYDDVQFEIVIWLSVMGPERSFIAQQIKIAQ